MGSADHRLVQRVLRGDRAAGESLARCYHVDLFNLFVWLTHDAELAQNLTQDTFVRIWERLPQFRGESGLRSWVHAVAFSVLALHRRDASRETRALAEYAERSARREAQGRPETRMALADALSRLSDDERRAVVLCKLQGFTLKDAAAILGQPAGTVAWRVAEGLKKMRAVLADDPAAERSPQPGKPVGG